MKTTSQRILNAAIVMRKMYCHSHSACLPRGSYGKIAEETGLDPQTVLRYVRAVDSAHVHVKTEGYWCQICYCVGDT